MDALITRLREQTEQLDTSDLTPAQHLPAVVRRGRRYMVAATAATVLGATAAVAGAAVAVPHVLQQFQDPQQPVVEPVGDDDPTPAAETDEQPDDEIEVPTVGVDPEPSVGEEDDTSAEPAESADVVAPADVIAPDLVVTSPADGETVTSKKVTFTGQVEPGAVVTAGPYAAEVSDDGSWSLLLIAGPGENTVTFTATDDAGNATTRTVTVTYTPPEKETPEEPVEDKTGGDTPKETSDDPVASSVDFTANQQHAELTAEPYKNVYWGTANPGEKVKVISDHGWGYAYADEAGNWELHVDFDPPAGTRQFTVTARYYHDSTVAETFQLTTVAPEAAAFTASQAASSVSAGDPTNTYSGTGESGHEVLVWTEAHGQVTTQVAADGTWQVTLTYQDVAPGETFKVKAADMTGGTRHYFEVTITE